MCVCILLNFHILRLEERHGYLSVVGPLSTLMHIFFSRIVPLIETCASSAGFIFTQPILGADDASVISNQRITNIAPHC